MTVTSMAKRAGVTPHAVRHYARQGLLSSQKRSVSGYRLFSAADLNRLRLIRVAQALGFSLAEIGELVRCSRLGHSPCPRSRETPEKGDRKR